MLVGKACCGKHDLEDCRGGELDGVVVSLVSGPAAGQVSEGDKVRRSPCAADMLTGMHTFGSPQLSALVSSLLCRSLTSGQLATLLRPRFQAHGEVWKLPQARAEVKMIDPGATGIAAAVLRQLKGLDALTPAAEMELIQGLANALRARGFGVTLHTTNAEGVREQILELTRKRFYAMARKTGDASARFKAASIAGVLATVEEVHVDGRGVEREIEYLVGWTLVPPNMMQHGWENFMPVTAWDCAGMRGRGQGILIARATKDGNNNIHPVSLSHMLAAEADRYVLRYQLRASQTC